jgi:hypothetical protein
MLDLDDEVLAVARQWAAKAENDLKTSTLLALVPAPVRPVLTPQEQDLLTEYAVTTRYPGDYDPISHEEARQAVQLARRLRNQVRRRLPEAIR